jgi:hypothetical protein
MEIGPAAVSVFLSGGARRSSKEHAAVKIDLFVCPDLSVIVRVPCGNGGALSAGLQQSFHGWQAVVFGFSMLFPVACVAVLYPRPTSRV